MDVFISYRADSSEAAGFIVSALSRRAVQRHKWIVCLRLINFHEDLRVVSSLRFDSPQCLKADCVSAFIDTRPERDFFDLLDISMMQSAMWPGPESFIHCIGHFAPPYTIKQGWRLDFTGRLVDACRNEHDAASTTLPGVASRSLRPDLRNWVNGLRDPSSIRFRADVDQHDQRYAVRDGSLGRDRNSTRYPPAGAKPIASANPYAGSFDSGPRSVPGGQIHLFGAMWKAWDVLVFPGLMSGGAILSGVSGGSKQSQYEIACDVGSSRQTRRVAVMPLSKRSARKSAGGGNSIDIDDAPPSANEKSQDRGRRSEVIGFPRPSTLLSSAAPTRSSSNEYADLTWTRSVSLRSFASNLRQLIEEGGMSIPPAPPRKTDGN